VSNSRNRLHAGWRHRRSRGHRIAVPVGDGHVLRLFSSRLPHRSRPDDGAVGDLEQNDPAVPPGIASAPPPQTVASEGGGEATVAAHDEPLATREDGAAIVEDGVADDEANYESGDAAPHASGTAVAAARWVIVTCSLAAAALGGVIGYLGYQKHVIQQTAQRDSVFVEAGRQAALNLTTISYTDVDRDVARVLDSATGSFHDDFQNRSGPFIAVVKQAQSTSRGTITEAGLSSVDGDQAQVIVAVSVTTSIAGRSNDDQPRGWRMRLNVQKVGDSAKVSDVQFVP
jgi:Mce-associated membrane protein